MKYPINLGYLGLSVDILGLSRKEKQGRYFEYLKKIGYSEYYGSVFSYTVDYVREVADRAWAVL